MNRVVITGLGTVNPLGNNVVDTWNALVQGKNGIGEITRFDSTDFSVKIAGEVKNFDPLTVLDRKEIRRMDRYVQLALCSGDEAINDAGLNLSELDLSGVGVLIASGIGGIETLENQHTILVQKGPKKISPFLIPMMIVNIASGQIAIKYGFKGPNYSVSSACASSGHGLISAMRLIERGEAEVMVAGGAEASVTPLSIGGFSVMKALSTRNDDPATASRPFDVNRDGFVVSEGAAVLILESLNHALKRGAKIYAEIAGAGQTCDAYHITAPDETGQGPASAMIKAMEDADITPEQVDYVNAHGTSTPYNDVVETTAIKLALGQRAYEIPVVSTKSMTGHLLGAASAIEALDVCLSMQNNLVHTTQNIIEQDPNCDLDYVKDKNREVQLNYVLSNSLGFGGHNISIVLKKYVQ
ncbi:MAG: beta-ketoacyl-ACP synthase II [bacterium]